ncbi:uncharacterized protein I206_101820 [Kwoniella pini CBS 10737]|uniref:F-box domain-containing protein n=1 Tax=Kwoniella pini CBS 10737 TaxID=1296096 RepID=A0A1B9HVM8_9TREE|nr:uncharacterized protein I206_07090 [Kwoniella pini CBS 10737]OCF47311.1 hypothetical protein I206_07090 [Kwoniella pini CBS 10737]
MGQKQNHDQEIQKENNHKSSTSSFHLNKVNDSLLKDIKEVQDISDQSNYKMGKSKSFSNLAEVFGFNYNYSRSSSRNNEILSRPKSIVNLERTSSHTKRHVIPEHLPTQIIIRILTYCCNDTLYNCLTVSRLLFNLSGRILYNHIIFDSPKDMFEKLKDSTILYENITGKITVGRKKFKDRLLKHTEEVTLHSHGDDNCNEEEEEEKNEKLSLFLENKNHQRSSSSSCSNSFNYKSKSRTNTLIEIPINCPNVSLNEIMPRLKILRIILADEFDYHLLFCPKFNSPCPLLKNLKIEKLIIIGARSPLVVLPNSFPSTITFTTPNSPPIQLNSNKKIKSTGGLPIGLKELTIILPTGRSYDLKDYEGFENIFNNNNNHSLNSIKKISIIFLTNNKRNLWQIAFYNSRDIKYLNSFSSLIEDLIKIIISLPLNSSNLNLNLNIIGIENFDGELFNMGIGIMKKGKENLKNFIIEKIKNQLYIKLVKKNKQNQINEIFNKINFINLDDWLENDGNKELGDNGFKELAKEGWREFR